MQIIRRSISFIARYFLLVRQSPPPALGIVLVYDRRVPAPDVPPRPERRRLRVSPGHPEAGGAYLQVLSSKPEPGYLKENFKPSHP